MSEPRAQRRHGVHLISRLVAMAMIAAAAAACAGAAAPCLLCASAAASGGDTEEDPRSVRDWSTPLGNVRETFWTPFSMPDSSFNCRYVLLRPDGARVELALVSTENHTCEARRAPTVDDGGHLIVASGGAFVVWHPQWARAREVPLYAKTFRRTVLTTLEPTLRITADTWTVAVFGSDAFVSDDAGETWRSVHADARLD